MFNAIDSLLDRITMYRLLLYYLIALVLIAAFIGHFGYIHYNAKQVLVSSSIVVFACWFINKIFALILQVPTNYESSIITGLILALIISPISNTDGITFLLAASGLAIASKYLLTIGNKHIFNPAAIAVVLTAFGPEQSASWWVGTADMLPFVLIGGLLLVRKIQRQNLVLTFLISAYVFSSIYTMFMHGNLWLNAKELTLSSALFFMGFVMLTEPMTSPTTSKKQSLYGLLAGILFPPQVHLFSIYSTPEIVLVIDNIFAYFMSPKIKLLPQLISKFKITPDSFDFVFTKTPKLAYLPGQYMEWTLPHSHTDSRGSRRYFTFASSPTEDTVRLGVKFYRRSSSFKKEMLKMTKQTQVIASQLAGDFIMPKDKSKKLAFIAGGIGITPYRSMIKYLLDTSERRDIIMLYSVRKPEDVAYKSLFEKARTRLGIKTVYTLTDQNVLLPDLNSIAGYITVEVIKSEIPDYKDRLFYISGTHEMVVSIESSLIELGIHRRQIKKDFFSGYA